MSTIHVKSGLEFRPELYDSRDRGAWLDAVGQELQNKGVAIKLGEGNAAFEIKNSDELKSFYNRYESDPKGVAEEIGLKPGRDIKRYVSDLVQALDDIVKGTSAVKSGDTIDLRTTGELSKMLGLDDASHRYASSRTQFGRTAPAEGTMSVFGAMLSRHEIAKDPLDGVPYMDATTFGNAPKTGRRSEEFEAVKTLKGLNKDELIGLLRSERNGKTVFEKMRKAADAEAFTLGYSGIDLDEMRWDSRAHKIREANPYISLTVESGRLEMDEKDGVHEVSLGNDYFEDNYYDTDNFDLLDNGMSIRGRVRRDDPLPDASAVRRVLVQSKIGSSVDGDGVKFAAKADIRKDNPSEADIAGLDEDVRTGVSGWGSWGSNPDTPIEAVGLVYDKLSELGKLEDIGDHKGVLQLKTKANVRSTRSRFHFNLTSRSSMQTLFKEAGEPNIKSAVELAKASTDLDPADAQKLISMGEGILDKSLFVEKCREQLAALDPNLNAADVNADTIAGLWPSQSETHDKLTAMKREVVANAINDSFHEFSELLDDNRSRIAGSRGSEMKPFDMSEDLVAFLKEKNPDMLSKQTIAPFLQKFDQELAGANKDAFIADFAKWAADKGNSTLLDASDKDAASANIRKHLVNENLDIMHRQIESAGSTSKALWFGDAKNAFADVSSSSWSNFLIDTFDVTEYYSPEQWAALSPEEKAGAKEVGADKMFHATLVNEVQIELGTEKPYKDAINKAQAAIQEAKAGLFMDFALANGSLGAVADNPTSFEEIKSNILNMPEAERTQLFDQLNAFSKDKGSPLTFENTDVQGFEAGHFSTRFQNKGTETHTSLLKEVEVNTFVWDRLVEAQEYIANLRGRRVLDEAERAGFNNTSWDNADMSKGDLAISMIKEGIQ